jgi:hypothetical protein
MELFVTDCNHIGLLLYHAYTFHKSCTSHKSAECTFVMLAYVLSNIRILFAKTTATCWGCCWQFKQIPEFVGSSHTVQFIVMKYCEIVHFLGPEGRTVGRFVTHLRGISAYLNTQIKLDFWTKIMHELTNNPNMHYFIGYTKKVEKHQEPWFLLSVKTSITLS